MANVFEGFLRNVASKLTRFNARNYGNYGRLISNLTFSKQLPSDEQLYGQLQHVASVYMGRTKIKAGQYITHVVLYIIYIKCV